jgi:hypothetical protein
VLVLLLLVLLVLVLVLVVLVLLVLVLLHLVLVVLVVVLLVVVLLLLVVLGGVCWCSRRFSVGPAYRVLAICRSSLLHWRGNRLDML